MIYPRKIDWRNNDIRVPSFILSGALVKHLKPIVFLVDVLIGFPELIAIADP
jgi:hypothetical protein